MADVEDPPRYWNTTVEEDPKIKDAVMIVYESVGELLRASGPDAPNVPYKLVVGKSFNTVEGGMASGYTVVACLEGARLPCDCFNNRFITVLEATPFKSSMGLAEMQENIAKAFADLSQPDRKWPSDKERQAGKVFPLLQTFKALGISADKSAGKLTAHSGGDSAIWIEDCGEYGHAGIFISEDRNEYMAVALVSSIEASREFASKTRGLEENPVMAAQFIAGAIYQRMTQGAHRSAQRIVARICAAVGAIGVDYAPDMLAVDGRLANDARPNAVSVESRLLATMRAPPMLAVTKYALETDVPVLSTVRSVPYEPGFLGCKEFAFCCGMAPASSVKGGAALVWQPDGKSFELVPVGDEQKKWQKTTFIDTWTNAVLTEPASQFVETRIVDEKNPRYKLFVSAVWPQYAEQHAKE